MRENDKDCATVSSVNTAGMAVDSPGAYTPYHHTVTDHHDGYGLNEAIQICADTPDEVNGRASHTYNIQVLMGGARHSDTMHLFFQQGPRGQQTSRPGLTEAALVAVVLDRLRGFQSGQFSCRENALAITKLEEAMHWMKHRADERARRGVLGKLER